MNWSRIGYIDTNTTINLFFVQEGGITIPSRFRHIADNVADFQFIDDGINPRIGILGTGGTFYVKEDSLDAPVRSLAADVQAFSMFDAFG
jgi:hypothetical protein